MTLISMMMSLRKKEPIKNLFQALKPIKTNYLTSLLPKASHVYSKFSLELTIQMFQREPRDKKKKNNVVDS